MNDYYNKDECKKLKDKISSIRYNCALTVGLYGKSISAGDVWEHNRLAIERLRKLDKTISYAFFVCQSIGYDFNVSYIHSHALIHTSLTDTQIKKCFSRMCDPHVGRLPTAADVERFADYILNSSRNLVWRNCEHIHLPPTQRQRGPVKRITYETLTATTGAQV